MKDELVKRYEYLYENIGYILGNYLVETNKGLELKVDDIFILALDEFLFGNNKIEDTMLHKQVDKIVKDGVLLVGIGSKIQKLDEQNKTHLEHLQLKITLETLLNIAKKSLYLKNDSKLNQIKKQVLDEYYRLLRYKNDGLIRYSGALIDVKDIKLYNGIPTNIDESKKIPEFGVKLNDFLVGISNLKRNDNYSIFTEKEKQDIYLIFHNELPHDLKIKCQDENLKSVRLDLNFIFNNGMKTEVFNEKPEACGEKFPVKEEDIIFYNNKFYTVCPNCGNFVRFPEELINNTIRKRIIERCLNDELFLIKQISKSLNIQLARKQINKSKIK